MKFLVFPAIIFLGPKSSNHIHIFTYWKPKSMHYLVQFFHRYSLQLESNEKVNFPFFLWEYCCWKKVKQSRTWIKHKTTLSGCTLRENQQLEHTVYQKPIEKNSNQHPRQKTGIIKTFPEWDKHICEPENLPEELKHLEKALKKNDYTSKEIKWAAPPTSGM